MNHTTETIAHLVRMAHSARDRQPETVIAVMGRKTRRRVGRPTVPADIGTLIHTTAQANARWAAPGIHGELLNSGLTSATVKDLSQDRPADHPVFDRIFRRQPRAELRLFLEFETVRKRPAHPRLCQPSP